MGGLFIKLCWYQKTYLVTELAKETIPGYKLWRVTIVVPDVFLRI